MAESSELKKLQRELENVIGKMATAGSKMIEAQRAQLANLLQPMQAKGSDEALANTDNKLANAESKISEVQDNVAMRQEVAEEKKAAAEEELDATAYLDEKAGKEPGEEAETPSSGPGLTPS